MIMREILIPATAILSIFGLPIFAMLAAVVATMIEKPRWAMIDKIQRNRRPVLPVI